MNPVAETAGLTVEVHGRRLLDGVDLTARAGRITALVGPSGSGKTTTGLALLGTFPPGARVTGTIRTPGPGAVGYVPQHPAAVLHPVRRAGALLADIAALRPGTRAERRARVEQALRDAQLPDPDLVLRRYPHQLSGGQQQRVVLAQALLLGARLIVADEPTTGQDPATRQGLVDTLAHVAAQGVAVVLLSHDHDVVRQLADETVVLTAGRVTRRGPTAEVLPAAPAPAPRRPRGPAAAARLVVRDLTARHGPLPVLHGLGLAVEPGECLAVTGRSGSGKTTLGRCLAGLHSAHDGTLLLDGTPLPRGLRARSRSQLAAVQYVFQDPKAAFDEHRPVLDQVARTAVRLRGADRHTAHRAAVRTLERLGLAEATARHRPGALSGGELQRAAVARSLLAEPAILVCDEITSGLDPATRDTLLAHLAELRDRRGLGLVLITHDRAAADTLADRTAALDAGRLTTSP
ncbi:ABC transporter ATP-binding protein [Streptomyces sp. R302]|uniref:ABC transporter ATP-binding protein n=1 Tax=unclassified Streptomyces TaxID=2593676 RepID=UPI00145FAD93|nr:MULTISPECIES: ATP-binding cassette domain-containing protein [unclassified Streptomyces]NML51951.1 ABC transporter ATP-binding protein [Streptomyces sp. R301]NML81571.1 ABC transporter ATP-binding protein [Streptomyces sp. R302]